MKLSGRCELLLSGDETVEPNSQCKFCSVKGVLDGNEDQVKVEIKEEVEVCPEVDAYSDADYLDDLEYSETTSARRPKKRRKRDKSIKEDPEEYLSGCVCKFCDKSFECNKMLISHTISEHRDKPGLKFLSFYMDKVSLDSSNGQLIERDVVAHFPITLLILHKLVEFIILAGKERRKGVLHDILMGTVFAQDFIIESVKLVESILDIILVIGMMTCNF